MVVTNLLKTFTISSSLPVFLATFIYVGMAFNKKNMTGIPYESIVIGIPLMFGIFGTINRRIVSIYGKNSSIIVGLLFGLMLSSIGRFILDLPVNLFNFSQSNEYIVHIFAMIFYSILFRVVITELQELLDP